MPPPQQEYWLSLIVQLLTVDVPLSASMPPPVPPVELLMMTSHPLF
jgi:hypothetical protein